MFELTDQEIVVYPAMTLMHPSDYANLDRTPFDLFYHVYVDKDTGLQIYPETKEPTYPTVDSDGFAVEFVSKDRSHNPWEDSPNWERARPPIGLTMVQYRNRERLRALTPRFEKRLSLETLWKLSRIEDKPNFAVGITIPGALTPTIGSFYCNNQTCSGSVYRTENEDEILIFAKPSDCDECLPREFDGAYLESKFEVTKEHATIEPGSYVLGPAQRIPLEGEPTLKLELSRRYTAHTIIDDDGWLSGIYLIAIKE